MARTLRNVLIGLLVVVLLVVAALAIFLASLDAERFRGALGDQIRRTTGLDVRLEGPLEIALWPEIALGVDGLAADWRDAGTEPLLAVEEARFRAALLPLLSTSPRLEVESVLFRGVDVELVVNADGEPNWTPPETEQAEAPAQDAPAEDGGRRVALAVDRVQVEDLDVRYRDLTADTEVRLDDLHLQARPGDADGPIAVDLGGALAMADGPSAEFQGALLVDARARRLEVDALRGELRPAEDGEALPFALFGAATLDAAGERLDLETLRLELAEAQAQLSGSVAELQTRPRLDLGFTLEPMNLRALLERFGALPAFRDPTALQRVGASMEIRGNTDEVIVDPLLVELDETGFEGNARLRTTPRPRLTFELEAPRFAPMRYAVVEDPDAPVDDGPLVSDAELDLSSLEAVDLEGRLAVGRLELEPLVVEEAGLRIRNDAGRVRIDVLAGSVLGGRAEGLITLDATAEPLDVVMSLDADDLDAGLLAPGLGFSGPIGLTGEVRSRGESTAALARALAGALELEGAPGILDVTGFKATLVQLASLLGHGERIADWPDQLEYQTLAGRWSLDGVDSQNLDFTVDNLQVNADGGVNLAETAFAYAAGIVFTDAAPTTFDLHPDLLGIRWPVRCSGELGADAGGNPCGFDQSAARELVQTLLRSRAAEPIRKKLEERIDQVPERYREPAQQLLRGLFGSGSRDDEQTEQAPAEAEQAPQ